MKFDVFQLHEPEEDTDNRKLLRVYSIIPRFSESKMNPMADQAIAVTKFLKEIDTRLKKEISPDWKNRWMNLLDAKYSKHGYKDWLIGRASIPLIALEKIKHFGVENEVNNLAKKIRHISSTTNETTLIPNDYSQDLLYLSGIILGDGCLPIIKKGKQNNFEYKISISSGNKENLLECKEIFDKLFSNNSRIYYQTSKTGRGWVLVTKRKVIYRFFKNIMKIPNGKKSIKAHIPSKIKTMPVTLQAAFLAGLVDSDIGKHGNGIGATFRSKKFVLDLIELLQKQGISAKSYGTHYKNNKFEQNDFRIPKGEVKKFKDLLAANYLPKRKDRQKTIDTLAGVP